MNTLLVLPVGQPTLKKYECVLQGFYLSGTGNMLSHLTPKQQLDMLRIAIRQMDRHDCHPVVGAAIALSKRDHDDFGTVFMEMAHVAKDGRLAYTRNLGEGMRDICTIMDPRKYIETRFSELSAAQIDSLFADSNKPLETTETTETEVELVEDSFLAEFLAATVEHTESKPEEDELPADMFAWVKANLPAGSKVFAIRI